MLNSHNLLILKKYKDSYFEYAHTDKIFKTFILDLYYEFDQNIHAHAHSNNYQKLFVSIFINNFIRYFYGR